MFLLRPHPRSISETPLFGYRKWRTFRLPLTAGAGSVWRQTADLTPLRESYLPAWSGKENDRNDDRNDGTQTPAYAGADHQEVARGRPAVGEEQRAPQVAKQLEVSETTLHRWRQQYGGLKAEGVKRLKQLERENGKLKRMLAHQLLEIDALKQIANGRMKFKSWTRTDRERAARLVPDRRQWNRLYRARLTLGEPVRGILRQPPPRRGARGRGLRLAARPRKPSSKNGETSTTRSGCTAASTGRTPAAYAVACRHD